MRGKDNRTSSLSLKMYHIFIGFFAIPFWDLCGGALSLNKINMKDVSLYAALYDRLVFSVFIPSTKTTRIKIEKTSFTVIPLILFNAIIDLSIIK
ncbi:hypothetical protein H8356DRAFT_1432722 [Neocallimastix lanati (nom. inval.)]|nr:hypothetical protein H8356DRAFT_1432722 [Neocallimastix sp. JGI-2020a]